MRLPSLSPRRFPLLLRSGATSLLLLGLASGAAATTVDLTSGVGSSGTINGVSFEFDKTQPAGTGVLNSFLRIQANGTEEGYNTSNAAFPFDEVPPAGGFTRDLTFGELQAVGGSFDFILDINEPNGGSQSLLSLDALHIYVSNTGSQNTTTLASLGTLIYDLDAGGDSVVLMDYDNAPGSGVSDVLMSVPESFFAGILDSQFIILYSRFGDTNGSGDGFEEWAHRTDPNQPDFPPIPEPTTFVLLAMGLVGLAVVGSPRRQGRSGGA